MLNAQPKTRKAELIILTNEGYVSQGIVEVTIYPSKNEIARAAKLAD